MMQAPGGKTRHHSSAVAQNERASLIPSMGEATHGNIGKSRSDLLVAFQNILCAQCLYALVEFI